MKRLRVLAFSAELLTLLAPFSLSGQTSGAPQQSGGGTNGSRSGSSQSPNPNQNEMQTPIFVSGRILMENGQPLAESISVQLNCDTGATRSVPAIHADRKGFFEFIVGSGPQADMDYSASSDVPFRPGQRSASTNLSGMSGSMGNGLTGCEVRASAAGYQPTSYTISHPPDLSRINVGTLRLKHLVASSELTVSLTSLQAPENARKEFDKGEADLRGQRFQSAREHLEKAVTLFDQYAAAWGALGNAYSASREKDKAYQAFIKAIEIDPKFASPYVGLANVELQEKKDEAAVESAEKALQLEPGNAMAGFLAAAGYFNLNRLDDAEKRAREAETRAAGSIPQLHSLLADIYLRKQEYENAVPYIRTYLKESPNGQFAERLRKDLQLIEAAIRKAEKETAISSKTQ